MQIGTIDLNKLRGLTDKYIGLQKEILGTVLNSERHYGICWPIVSCKFPLQLHRSWRQSVVKKGHLIKQALTWGDFLLRRPR